MNGMKDAGAYWDCYDGCKYCGWEFEKVITVAGGIHVTELITRARQSYISCWWRIMLEVIQSAGSTSGRQQHTDWLK